ncbi:MAG: TIGR02302 family protein [Alphaproteobacteria bacterium]|nr:TIGR02302 family protein [Alphaproteobacteria bacterium]
MNRRRGDAYWLWRVSLSAVVLFCERLWRALWPALGVAGLFVSFALFDLFAAVPGWLHALILVAFVAALGAAIWWDFRRFRLPEHTAARRRLEQVNNLDHRPLEALDDDVAGGADANPVTRALWQRHQEKMRDTVAGLRVGVPHPRLARKDLHALRFGIVIALGISVIVAGDDYGNRLMRALLPDVTGAPARDAKLDAWLTPPEYTGKPPVFLAGGADGKALQDPITAPQGSVLVAQVSDAGSTPVIQMPERALSDEAFDATAESSYRARVSLEHDGRVAIVLDGRELGAWDIVIIPDRAPTVAFLSEPGQTALGALRIDFEAHDDYGLAGVSATIRRPEVSAIDAETITFDLPLPGLNAADAAGTGYQDLTPHPWAGLPVQVQLTARDGRGQRGTSGAISIVLPERSFSHPVAREIIAQRKHLTAEPEGARHSVGAALQGIAARTDAYDGDVVVFMALNAASRRLKYSTAPDTVKSVQELLWDTALRLEDGELSLAARELRRLQQELMEALANDASDEELARLMDELEAALNELLDALARMQPQDMDALPFDPEALAMTREDLKNLFDRMRELAQNGAKDAARQMLAELQNLLENLQAGRMGQAPPEFRQGMQMLDALQELIQGQQELLDRTYNEAQRRGQQGGQQPPQNRNGEQQGQQGQRGQQGQQGNGDSVETALQEALRRQLGDIMRQLGELTGEIPRQFGRAEGAMRNSTDALRSDQPGASVPAQTEALDQLREGARAATEQLMQQFGGGMQAGVQRGRPSMQFGQQDPFGRRMEGSQGTTQGDVEIPSESDIQRARRILEELRRRAGERERPPVERDYIERLLEPY